MMVISFRSQGIPPEEETSMARRPRTQEQSPHRAQGRTRRARRRPMIELLEDRCLLSTTITVNTLSDPATPVAGQTSLRQAITTANADPGGGDTINFASGLTGKIGLTQGALPAISAAMTITGPGAAILTVDGLSASGIFAVTSQLNVSISGLTLANGKNDQGGAVSNTANLTISNCVITGNSASNGGGISNTGTLTISNSTIESNTAATSGGGIWDGGGQVTMVGCTVAGNSCTSLGGGVEAYTATLTMINCTVADNVALGFSAGGGGVAGFSASVTLSDCTVADNSAAFGGGILNYSPGGIVTLNNTIAAGNAPGGDISNRGQLVGSRNLVGDASSAGGLQNGVNGNIVGVDPKLRPSRI